MNKNIIDNRVLGKVEYINYAVRDIIYKKDV